MTLPPDRPFDVVLLDAGGVLVIPNTAQVVARFAEADLSVTPDHLLEAHYRGVLAIDQAQADPEVFTDYHAAYAAHLGMDPAPDGPAVTVLRGLWEEAHLWTQPLPGAADGLRAIADAGLPIVIVSNADGTVADKLAQAGLLQVGPGPGIDVVAIIDSGAVGVAKPDPAIFDLALAEVGATADRAVHVGDAYQYDVLGARAAGVQPVLMDPLGLRGDADCDRITSLADVLGLSNRTRQEGGEESN